MTHKLSKDFEKRFWQKFHREFPKKKFSFAGILTPVLASLMIVAIFSVTNQLISPKADLEAINIALEVDESLGAILDSQNYLEDEEDIWSEVI